MHTGRERAARDRAESRPSAVILMPSGVPPPMGTAQTYAQVIQRFVVLPMRDGLEAKIVAAKGDYEAIRQAIEDIPNDPAVTLLAPAAAKQHIQKVKAYHTEEFRKKMRGHFGVKVDFLNDATLAPIMQKSLADNISLIKTIPPKFHASLLNDFAKLTAAGPFDQAALAAVLTKNYQSTGYNVRRIARDQTTKLIGRLTQARQEDLGVEEYVWQTSEDESVRETHRLNNGQTFQWAKPPSSTGHPGEDIQCRCVAIAVIPKFSPAKTAKPTKPKTAKPAPAPAPTPVPTPDPIPIPTPTPPPLPPVQPPSAIPTMQRAAATVEQIGGQGGSNPGGIYIGADGVKRYVKFYRDVGQAYNEAVVNNIYRELGYITPKSTLVYEGDELVGIANEMIDNITILGKQNITQKKARDTLQGLTTDSWLANWDAVGPHFDNTGTIKTATGVKIVRIDQGGSLLHRGLQGRKNLKALEDITEFEAFADPYINKQYAEIFPKAGYKSAEDAAGQIVNQIKEINKLRARTNDFADLVPKLSGYGKAAQDADDILRLLRIRADVLNAKILPRMQEAAKAARAAKRAAKRAQTAVSTGPTSPYTAEDVEIVTKLIGEPINWERVLKGKADKRGVEIWKNATDLEIEANNTYTGGAYRVINRGLRALERGETPKGWTERELLAFKRIANAGLLNAKKHQKMVYRGHTADAQTLEMMKKKYAPGNVVHEAGFSSSARVEKKAWDGEAQYNILSKHGVWLKHISNHPGEDEVLFRAGAKFRVLRLEEGKFRKGGKILIHMEELDE